MSPTLKDKIAVEPLDDERWLRLERGVVGAVREGALRRGEVRAQRRGWIIAGAFAAMAAATGLVVWTVVGKSEHKPTPAGPLAIATDAKGSRVDLGDAVVAAAPETSFTVTRPGGGIELALARGTIQLDVPSRAGKAPLVVHAADVDVIDVGTVFSVARTGDDVAVAVTEGEVQVAHGGRIDRVVAGQSWSSPRIASATPVPVPVPDHLHAIGPTPSTSGTAPAIPIGGPDDLLGKRHVASAPSTSHGNSSGNGSGNGSGSGSGNGSGSGSATGTGSGAPIVDLHKAIIHHAIAPAAPTTGADPAAEYTQMLSTHGDDAIASKGLYGLARLRFDAGDARGALHFLDAYLKRFTGEEPELEPVLWLRVRILCGEAIGDPCRAAAQTYLAHYPSDDPSFVVNRITVTR